VCFPSTLWRDGLLKTGDRCNVFDGIVKVHLGLSEYIITKFDEGHVLRVPRLKPRDVGIGTTG